MSLRVLSEARLPGADFERMPGVHVAQGGLRDVSVDNVGALVVIHERVDHSLLDQYPEVKVVARYGIGYDQVDIAACTERNVQIGITPGPVEHATAELTVAMVLSAQWDLSRWALVSRSGGWGSPMDELPAAQGVYGARLGVLGMGRVGFEVAKRMIGLGMTVKYASRTSHRKAEDIGACRITVEELMASSDVVSVHLPLNQATRGFVDARMLALMRDDALFVNTARGPIVDEAALLAELRSGRIRAALDVFWHEPDIPEALRTLDNVLLTPHIGSQTSWARTEMTRLVVENVLAGLEGRRIPHGIPEQQGMASL